MKTNIGDEVVAVSYADQLAWVMYQALWLLPICGLCYACSMAWYQDLADSTYRYLQGVPRSTPLTKSVGNALYGTLVWLSAFIQVKLLAAITPMLFSQLAAAVELFFVGWTATAASGGASTLFSTIGAALKHSILMWINGLSLVSRFFGLALLCLMYGWYGFDPKWIASGLDPDARFGILERHWAYFIGFGFPYVMLMENTSFFVGYGAFLGLFPFCILLGSVCDYSAPYSAYSDKRLPINTSNNTLPLFKTAQQWTLLAIKYIDKQAYAAHKQKSSNASGDAKEKEKAPKAGSKKTD
jgi:etoposide-induced 2.4 mRNA